MTNESEILAQKRAWSKCNEDRRKKDGSIEDRKLTADCRRIGRLSDRKNDKIEKNIQFHASMLFIIICIWAILIILFAQNKAHAEDINLDVIADIESAGNPLAYNRESQATGMYQITDAVIQTYLIDRKKLLDKENAIEDTRMPMIFALSDMYEPKYAFIVANWLLNTKIPSWLNYYHIPDNRISRLIAYNWGIGHLRKWFNRGSHWNQLPRETRNYIKKYFKEVENNEIN